MAPNLMLEIKLVKRFVEESRQNDYIEVLASIKTRKNFIDSFASFDHFKQAALEAVTGDDLQLVISKLSQYNMDVNKCYVISQDPTIDTEIMGIEAAVSTVTSNTAATMLVFGNAEMIYYKNEKGERYISNATS